VKVPPLSQDDLKARLLYDRESGMFSWIGKPGKEAGRRNQRGYLRIQVNGRTYQGHRLAWLYVNGEDPDGHVDHINGDPRDNRIENLRVCSSRADNMANQRLRTDNTTSAKGVMKTSLGRFRARLYADKKSYDGGCHDTVDEAAHAYNKLAIQHCREFAVLNPIGADK
jgi:hypothetical protein